MLQLQAWKDANGFLALRTGLHLALASQKRLTRNSHLEAGNV